MEAQLRREGARCDVVRAAEGGEEVIECNAIRNVDGSQLKADLVFISVEKIVVAHGKIEEIAWGDAGGVVIGVVGSGCGDRDQRRSVLRSGAETVGTDGRAKRICRTWRSGMN